MEIKYNTFMLIGGETFAMIIIKAQPCQMVIRFFADNSTEQLIMLLPMPLPKTVKICTEILL